MDVLDRIVETKKREIAALKAAKPLEEMMRVASAQKRVRRPFQSLFATQNVLIAEVKPKSPSAGELTESPLEVAEIYAKSTADVISVLTDHEYFGGSLELLQQVRKRVPQAVVRKDFLIEPYQLYETVAAGADAYLLIARILSAEELTSLIELGHSLQIDPLVEVHDAADVAKALAAKAPLIGINNRNLQTLAIDLAVTEALRPTIPRNLPVVSESGIATLDEVRRVKAAKANGILVGTSILRSADPLATIRSFKVELGV